jgi:uroporphyrinogen decarboxylase
VGAPNGDGTFTDEWGVIRAAPQAGGIFGVVRSPLSGEITTETIRGQARTWPDPARPALVAGVGEAARRLRNETGYAVVLNLPLGLFHYAQFLRGYEAWLMDLALDPDLVRTLHDALLEVTLEQARHLLDAVGDAVDVVCYGDDVAANSGPLVAPRTYRQLLRPYLERVFGALRQWTGARILYHCDGDVTWLLDDLIAMGVDAINPVQVSTPGLADTAAIKARFGERIAFWGGIDTERVLPFGSPADVRAEVRRRVADLAPGGGYVLASVHNIQAEVPPENVVALFAAANEPTTS